MAPPSVIRVSTLSIYSESSDGSDTGNISRKFLHILGDIIRLNVTAV